MTCCNVGEWEREREREREQPPWGPWATSLTWGSIIHKLSQSYGYTFTLVRSLFPVLELNGHKNVFLLFCYYLPFEPSRLNFSFGPKDKLLSQVCLKLAWWFFRRGLKCEKFTDRQSDNGRRVIRKSSVGLSNQVIY